MLPTAGVPIYGAKPLSGQPWQVFVPLAGVLGLPYIPCVSCGCGDELFVMSSCKEGMEEGKNGMFWHGGSALLMGHHNGKSKMKYKELKLIKNNQTKPTTTTITKNMLAHF